MKPAVFEYDRVENVDALLQKLSDYPDAKILAGGQSLIPSMNFRLARPTRLIDIGPIGALRGLGVDAQGRFLEIGAMVRHQSILESPLIGETLPIMRTVAEHIGHWAVRTQGTVGGSLCHADPAGEWPAFMTAAGALLRVRSEVKSRTIPAEDFFTGYMGTVLEPGEFLERIDIPLQAADWGFYEITRRPGDFAAAGAIFRVQGNGVRAAVFGGALAHAALFVWSQENLASNRGTLFRSGLAQTLENSDAYTEDIFVEAMKRACSQALSQGRDKNGR